MGEQQDLRELFLLSVEDDVVLQYLLRPGDPDYGQPGYRGLEDRQWLTGSSRRRNLPGQAQQPPSFLGAVADDGLQGLDEPGSSVNVRDRRTG